MVGLFIFSKAIRRRILDRPVDICYFCYWLFCSLISVHSSVSGPFLRQKTRRTMEAHSHRSMSLVNILNTSFCAALGYLDAGQTSFVERTGNINRFQEQQTGSCWQPLIQLHWMTDRAELSSSSLSVLPCGWLLYTIMIAVLHEAVNCLSSPPRLDWA